jgi:hypothetical protein
MKAPLLSTRRVRAARALALLVDLGQIVLLPAFLPAVASPVADVVDVAAAVALILLVGWHWAFLPTFFIELVPVVDVVPTWTAAVFLATRGRGGGEGGPVVEAPPPSAKPLPGDQPRGPSGS